MHSSLHRSLALSLALCAMLLRGLLPAGWMPNLSADAASSPFIICSVDGAHGGGKAPSDSTGERTHAPCAFAAVAHLAPPAFAPARLAAPACLGRIDVARGEPRSDISVSYRPQIARGPPVLS